MRIVSVCLLFLSAGLATSPVLATNEDWSGFWRLELKSPKADDIFQLWVSEAGGVQLYDKNWKAIEIDLRGTELEHQSFKLRRDVRGGLLDWSATREGDTLSGTWEFHHFQSSLKGDLSGSQISKEGLKQWSPVKAAHANLSAERVLNLPSLLEKGVSSQGDFEGYWSKVFVPGYLAFLPELPEVSRALAVVTDAAALKVSQDFEGVIAELVRQLAKNYPTFRFTYDVVVTPFVEEIVRLMISEESYLLMNPASLLKGLDPEKDKLKISRKVLAAQLFRFTRHYKRQSGTLVKLGLELFLMEKAYPDQLPQILGVGEKRLRDLQEKLPGLKQRVGSGKRLRADEQSYLGLDFVRGLVADKPFEGVLSAPPTDIVNMLARYLHPAPGKPGTEENPEASQGSSTGKNRTRP